MFKIECKVSGGMTGTRVAMLKDKDGQEQTFVYMDQAQAEADRLNKSMNHEYSSASFRYTVVNAACGVPAPCPCHKDVTEDEFMAFERVRESGATNMNDVRAVCQLSGLSRMTVMRIMKDYTRLNAMYLSKES